MLTLDSGLLVAGDKVIAIKLHQDSDGSSDVAFDMELYGTAEAKGIGFDILSTTEIVARVLVSGDLSAWTETQILVGEPMDNRGADRNGHDPGHRHYLDSRTAFHPGRSAGADQGRAVKGGRREWH